MGNDLYLETAVLPIDTDWFWLSMNLPHFLLLLSIGALGAAYVAEYGFDLEPCILCLYQRIPYFVVLGCSLVAIFTFQKVRLVFVALCGVALIVGAFVAAYHVAVEHGLVTMEDGCADTNNVPSTLAEMTMQVLGTTHVPCDEPQFTFLGVSMAGWNLLFSGFFGMVVLSMSVSGYRSLRLIQQSDDYRAQHNEENEQSHTSQPKEKGNDDQQQN